MPERADAHIHLFAGGYRDSFTARPGVSIDEVACFQSLMPQHQVSAALVVGYAAADWCRDNNAYIAQLARTHRWVRPTAYVDPSALTVSALDNLARDPFVGISLYIFDDAALTALVATPDDAWDWLAHRGWLLSVNSRGSFWSAWQPILQRHPNLRLLISHMGLPPAVSQAPSRAAAEAALQPVLELARFPHVRVKLSGFYALTQPGHDYPHAAAWPYVHALHQRFGVERLLWASDFAPCLDWLSYPQTYDLLRHMSWFTAADRARIEGANLLALLNDV